MTVEPVYTYRKGEGWVLETVETRTAELGIYRFTVEKRPPNIGERWTSDSRDIDTFFEHSKRFWNWHSPNLPKVICRPFEVSGRIALHKDVVVYTIKLELL